MTFDYFQNRTYSSNSSETSLSGRGVEYKEKEGVWIPAHSSRRFCEFTLMDVPYRQCGFARNPSRNEDMTLSFTEKNSPYAFDNVLMLVVNGIDRRIVNSFYVSSLTNIQSDETYEDKHVENCDGSKSSEIVRIYKHLSANRFFINYDYNSQHDRDTDDDRTQRKLSPFLGL